MNKTLIMSIVSSACTALVLIAGQSLAQMGGGRPGGMGGQQQMGRPMGGGQGGCGMPQGGGQRGMGGGMGQGQRR